MPNTATFSGRGSTPDRHGLLVRPDRDRMASEHRTGQHHVPGQHHGHRQKEGRRESDACHRRPDGLHPRTDEHGAGSGRQVGTAARRLQHAERHDERRDTPPHRHEPVGQTTRQPHEHGHDDARTQCPLPLDESHPEHRPPERENRTDRQIDARDDEHERHSDGNHRQRRHLIGQGGQRESGEEMLAEQAEEYDEQAQHAQHAEVLGNPGAWSSPRRVVTHRGTR